MRLNIRFGHDAAASISEGGKVLVSVAEERISRIKNDSQFPEKSIRRCLEYLNCQSDKVQELAISSSSYPKKLFDYIEVSDQIEQEVYSNAIKGFSLPAKIKNVLQSKQKNTWFKSKMKVQNSIKLHGLKSIIFADHHLCHAANALQYAPSSRNLGVVVMDGIGDGTSVSVWKFESGRLTNLLRLGGEYSLGWFYGIATEAFGWVHGTDEWKLMGLAAYGDEVKENSPLAELCPSPRLDPSLRFGAEYPNFTMFSDNGTNIYRNPMSDRMKTLRGDLSDREYASTIQNVVEQRFRDFILDVKRKFNFDEIAVSGGFFLNVKNNQKLFELDIFENIFISPDAGDSGLVNGCAKIEIGNANILHSFFDDCDLIRSDTILSPYLGPDYSNDDVRSVLIDRKISFKEIDNPAQAAAALLQEDKIIGWFQGRMEAGARALGNRSILANPTKACNKDRVNKAIKYREGFRPFCPSMLDEDAQKFLEGYYPNKHMTSSFKTKSKAKEQIPAVVHIDGTCRIQLVDAADNELYFSLLTHFKKMSGVGVVLNTSFNIKGEPIVENPRQALKCLFDTGIDALIIGNFLIEK